MYALQSYKETGMDCQVVIGDEDVLRDILRYADVSKSTFTVDGKLEEEALAKFLKALAKKGNIQIQVLCVW